MNTRMFFWLLAASFIFHPAFAEDNPTQRSSAWKSTFPANQGITAPATFTTKLVAAHRTGRANFAKAHPSLEARQVADWVVDSGDNQRMPFVIVDKVDAKVFVFHSDGRLRGSAPALLGLARGDGAVPGIGDRKLSSIRPEERTTPAGRFVASLGHNFHGKEILWVDYAGAVSLHPVVTSKPAERRKERLASLTPLDNRISFGCINVTAKFFTTVVRPVFNRTYGVVYVLPETSPAREFFGAYNVAEHERQQPFSQPVFTIFSSGTAFEPTLK